MEPCPCCGRPKHTYGATFVALWTAVMRFFPVYSLPTPQICAECAMFQAGMRMGGDYRRRRKQWLESTAPVPTLDLNDPDVWRQLQAGQRLARSYKKMIKDQKEKMKKIRTKRYMKAWDRKLRKRDKEIRKVLERAAEI